MQSLLHPEFMRVVAADASRGGPRISRQQPRVLIWRRRPLRWTARTRPAAAKGRA